MNTIRPNGTPASRRSASSAGSSRSRRAPIPFWYITITACRPRPAREQGPKSLLRRQEDPAAAAGPAGSLIGLRDG
ncbi:hypothetical protein GCM10023334_064560 [Nonomuraea thailandensis]